MQVIDTSLGFINRNNKISLKTEFEGNSTTILHGNYFGTIYDIFHDIYDIIEEAMQSHITLIEPELEDLFEIDSNIRKQVKEKIYKC